MKKFLMVALVLSLSLLQVSPVLAADRMKFYVVSHGGPADPFWGVVMRGAEDAGKEFGVDVTYLGPEKFSIQKLVNMVETAVADNPDGLVVTITDAKALDQPLKDAIKKGIDRAIDLKNKAKPGFKPIGRELFEKLLRARFIEEDIDVIREDLLTDSSLIRENLEEYFNKNIFFVSKKEVVERIHEKFPIVAGVKVERVFPNTLKLELLSYPIVANIKFHVEKFQEVGASRVSSQ